MTVKVDAAPDDVEKHIQNGGGVPSKEDAANQVSKNWKLLSQIPAF